jgi:hypothetical protein
MKELEQRAKRFHRPVEEEAKATLLEALLNSSLTGKPSALRLLDVAKMIRERHPNASITDEWLRAARDEGRP